MEASQIPHWPYELEHLQQAAELSRNQHNTDSKGKNICSDQHRDRTREHGRDELSNPQRYASFLRYQRFYWYKFKTEPPSAKAYFDSASSSHHLLPQDVFSHLIWRKGAKRGRLGKWKTFLRATQLCLSSMLRFQFAAIAVPKHLLCTLEQTDDSCEDPRVSHCQGEHHFCLGQGPYSRGDKDNQRGLSYAQIPRSLRTLQPHRGSAAGFAEVFLLRRLSLAWAPGEQAGRSDSGNRGEGWSSARSCSAHQVPSPLLQDLADSWRCKPSCFSPDGEEASQGSLRSSLPTYPALLSHFISRKSGAGSTPLFSAQLQYNPSLLGRSQLKDWVKEGAWWQQNPKRYNTAFWSSLTTASHVSSYVQKATPALTQFLSGYKIIFFFFSPLPKRIKATKEHKERGGRTAAAWGRWETRGSCLWC